MASEGRAMLKEQDKSSPSNQEQITTPSSTPLPPGILARHSSHTSTTSRRSSIQRSPMLSAQPDPVVPQRFNNSQQEKQDMLNAMEAEEEALVNHLSRKLEKLRAEKVELESTLEMEQEALVNRLQRRLSELLSQQQFQQTLGLSSSTSASYPGSPTAPDTSVSPIPGPNIASYFSNPDPVNPSPATLLDALHSENTALREQLAEAESITQQVERINEMYRRELLQLREKAGLDTSDIAAPPSLPAPKVREAGPRAGVLGSSSGLNGAGAGAIRIPGVPQSPPGRTRSMSKSSYSPSISSALSMGTPYSASPATHVTTPSTSYTTPQAPASTPVSNAAGLVSGFSSSSASTPYGSMSSSTSSVDTNSAFTAPSYRVPPPSMASSLGAGEAVSSEAPGTAVPYTARMMASTPIQERPESSLSSRSASPQSLRRVDNYSPESLQRRLSNSRQGARVAETGFLKKRTPSGNILATSKEEEQAP
ncbi:hypothetical protein P389DRAFT_207164 [Cystobasidium minutum MCA 4210]|uniref:uncharacterized protein n=1 Tax=Cystobasidium minutum MCA 4210 TaxID=1397322 RepID=UPI0034CF48CF|eukprot:jgi/Rhomi1/207164/estExt_Genemark1.C_1_t10029